ncbi:MAG: RNA methyltransferase [Halobacteriaceae archaeon]
MTVAIALVDAETPGNVGTAARSMKNFGFADLKLVDPPPLEPEGEAYGFAGHAREDVLPNAEELSFDTLVESYHTVGFTAHTNRTAAKHVRYPFATPAELDERLREVEADTALVFGREGTGLSNEEIKRLDEVCAIPAADEYPVLNLGQAVTVACYELRAHGLTETQLPDPSVDRAEEAAIEGLYEQFRAFLDAVDYRPVKRDKTTRLMRRLVGRAHPTDREVRTLRGVFRRGAEVADDED